jgi:hypothetical protein
MKNEIFLAPKRLGTLGAVERRLPGVNPLVLDQTLASDEAFSTVRAPMRPLSRVRANMHHQLGFLGKHLGAEFALENALGPRSVVRAHVSLQTAEAPQLFAADGAVDLLDQIGNVEGGRRLAGATSYMRHRLVRVQLLFAGEILAALTTLVVQRQSIWVGGAAFADFLIGVRFVVLGGLVRRGKSNGTDGTSNDLTTSVVARFVIGQIALADESGAAVVALEFFVGAVPLNVRLEPHRVVEGFVADGAREVPLVVVPAHVILQFGAARKLFVANGTGKSLVFFLLVGHVHEFVLPKRVDSAEGFFANVADCGSFACVRSKVHP